MTNEAQNLSNKLLTINEMWSLMNREESNWGIEGYEIAKKYVDARKQMKDREILETNLKVWSKKGHYDKVPPKLDKDGKEIIPKRPNYLDEVIKLANSFYSEERAQKILEENPPEEKKDEKPKTKDKNLCKLYKSDRMLYTDWLILFEKNKIKPRAEEIKDLDKIMLQINEKRKSDVEKMKEKYQKYGSMPKGDRVTVVNDAEYVGERIPFYSTNPADLEAEAETNAEEGGKKKKKTEKKLAFPHKDYVWHKDPAWTYKKPLEKNTEVLERKKELVEGKMKEITDALIEKKVELKEDVMKSYHNMQNWRKLYVSYNKPVEKSDQYKTWKEANPLKYPGPQQYFKTPLQNFKKKVKKNAEDAEDKPAEEEGKEQYFCDRKKCEKRIYKPMKGHIF